MSRCPGRHAKINTKYEGRHIKPGQPGAAALIGTALWLRRRRPAAAPDGEPRTSGSALHRRDPPGHPQR